MVHGDGVGLRGFQDTHTVEGVAGRDARAIYFKMLLTGTTGVDMRIPSKGRDSYLRINPRRGILGYIQAYILLSPVRCGSMSQRSGVTDQGPRTWRCGMYRRHIRHFRLSAHYIVSFCPFQHGSTITTRRKVERWRLQTARRLGRGATCVWCPHCPASGGGRPSPSSI